MPTEPLEEIGTLRIASPCTAAWDQMVGDERTRFCARCTKNVYNLQGMTAAEVRQLLKVPRGAQPPCIRFYTRRDGTVLTADCPVGLARIKREMQYKAAALACLVVTFVVSGYSKLTSGQPMFGGDPGCDRRPPTQVESWLTRLATRPLPIPANSNSPGAAMGGAPMRLRPQPVMGEPPIMGKPAAPVKAP